jgi:redox-sensitive bicupin YhaK (pirin superfamily)
VGAPDHPHRGFETVTYLLEGSFEHKDSHGHHGVLRAGDVQWMTAGAGVVHSEMPSRELREKGGRLHGFQIWVNLPRKDKMMRPRYQEVKSAGIPVARSADGLVQVKVIAGESLGAKAVIDTRIPIAFLHARLEPGGRLSQPLPEEFNAFAYVVSGAGRFGPAATAGKEGDMIAFAPGGEELLIAAPADAQAPLEVLILGGRPLREPVARYGPFVMNTEGEIRQAIVDYQDGRMGEIAAAT